MRVGSWVAVVAVAVGLTSACDSGLSADDLDGTTYTSTSVSGRDLVEETAITLVFDGDRVSTNAGCNTSGGRYEIDGGTLRAAGEWASTTIGCPDDLAAQDDWLQGMLEDGVGAELDDHTLTLTSDDVTIDMTAE
ncbi:hypothetical protein GCM10009795_061070 [Nocardioides hankookensis]|uniref:META domain-containing protein n=1 Tax=Nocardioides hankookensis TaxID=443157 RepID=A0ABW1LMU1_9ACTN